MNWIKFCFGVMLFSIAAQAESPYEVESHRKKQETETILAAVSLASAGVAGHHQNYISPQYQVLMMLPTLQMAIISKSKLVKNIGEVEKNCRYGHELAIMTTNKCSYYICKTQTELNEYYYFCYNKINSLGEIVREEPKVIDFSYDRDGKLKTIHDNGLKNQISPSSSAEKK